MKKSKILFIITIVLFIITIGLFFYKNSCNQKERDYLSEHMTDDVKLKWNSINQSEYDKIQEQKSELWEARTTSQNVFLGASVVTGIFFASGIVVFIIEKKKKI